MRLLQLNPTGSEADALDFHPMVTVVTGLSDEGRQRVRSAVTALPRSGDPGCPGLLEAHGIFLDLDVETLAMLDLDADVQVVLESSDLKQVGIAAPQAVLEAVALDDGPITAEQLLEMTPVGVNPVLDAARKAQSDSREALAILRTAAESARTELDEVSARRRRAQAALDASTAGDEADAAALDLATRTAETERLATRAEELEAELQRINRGIAELRGLDIRPIEVLLEAIRNPEPVEYVASDRARELVEEMRQIKSELDRMEEALEQQGRGPRTAMAALEAARAELAEAERRMAKPELSPEQEAELEAAHEAVLEADRKASGGIGRKAAQRRLEEALAREEAALAAAGFPTWSAYVMGADLLEIDLVAQERVEKARFEVEAAEAQWAQVSQEMLSDPAHISLIEQMEAHYMEAIDLLGGEPEGDLETELLNLKVAKREVTVDELVDALAYQLDLIGMPLGPNPVLDMTVRVAEAFVEEASNVAPRIAELEEERSTVEAELAAAERQMHNLEQAEHAALDVVGDVLTDGVTDPELEVVLAEAIEAEEEAREFLEAREALLDAAIQIESVQTGRLKKLAAELAATETDVRAADPLAAFDDTRIGAATEISFVDTADADAGKEALEFFLLSRLAAVRSLSFAGSVPLVLDNALVDLDPEARREVLEKLEKMSDSVQLIYLSDAPDVAGWAQEVGFQRAAVVEAPVAFA
ncbi:MAG: hypothetical protein JJU45_13025 [Acidimicrobiia bacterium]|nr:hypothetical protein [Acidimicrobiia bacterium]